MPASVFIHLDGIQAGIGGEGFPRHLSHEVVAPFVWTQEDFQLAGKDLAVSLNECHIGLSGVCSDHTVIDALAGVRRWGWMQPAPSHSLTAEMTRMLSLDLAVNEQDHVFAVATSTDVFLADFDVGLVGRMGGGSALAVIDRADVTDYYFVEAHDLGLPVCGCCYPHRDRWCQSVSQSGSSRGSMPSAGNPSPWYLTGYGWSE